MDIIKNDRDVLRNLASQYMDIATMPMQKEKIELWKAVNGLRMQRPMVTIHQLCWNELNNDNVLKLQVKDPFWRRIEKVMRQTIYKWRYFPVDMVVDPFIGIPKAAYSTGYGLAPDIEREYTDASNEIAGQYFHSHIKDFDDIEKIKDPVVTHDEKETELRRQQANEIFNGIAPVLMVGLGQHDFINADGSVTYGYHLGIWDDIVQYLNPEQVLCDLIERPEFMFAVAERFTQSKISEIRQANELGLHNDCGNLCHCVHTYDDELLPGSGEGKGPVSQNCWGYGAAQLFTAVSPQTTAEFEIPFMSRMAEYFGRVNYGCCERLDTKLDLVKKVPNVCMISCSPWSDREKFAEKIGKCFVMAAKPTPAFLAEDTFDEDVVRADLQYTADVAKNNGVNLIFALKDISTVRYEPQRLTRWAEIAMEVASN